MDKTIHLKTQHKQNFKQIAPYLFQINDLELWANFEYWICLIIVASKKLSKVVLKASFGLKSDLWEIHVQKQAIRS